MDLRVLRYLDEVVLCGGYGRAAERLHVSQPALSKAIRLLEEELDVQLLDRGRRGVGLTVTAAGEVVVRHARQLLQGRAQMLRELDALRGLEEGELSFGLPPLGSAEIFAPLIARYRERYPGIELRLRERGGEALAQAVQSGEIELAATILPVLHEDLDISPVRDDPMVVALPRSHPLSARTRLVLADLAETPLVLFEDSYVLNRVIHEACLAAGFTPREVAFIGQPAFGLALVAADAGAMLLPAVVAAQHATDGVVMVPLDDDALRWRLVLVWRRGTTLSYAARALLEMLPELIGRD
jgi:DNA-binding transcriptional LysR family regulator